MQTAVFQNFLMNWVSSNSIRGTLLEGLGAERGSVTYF